MTTNKIKLLVISFIAIVAILMTWAITTSIQSQGKIKVTIEVYPRDSLVTIDGKGSSAGEVSVTPGEHTFIASKKGFIDGKKQVSVSTEANYIGIALTPYSDEAKKFVENDPDGLDVERIVGKSLETESISIIDQYPVIAKLPYQDLTAPYSIDYGANDIDGKPFIVISNSVASSRAQALRWIYENNNGSLSNLEIRFRDESLIRSEQYK